MTDERRDDDDLDVGDLRSVFASMREADDEPPATGMAALMAAARVKADEMRPQPTWWERVSSLMRSPVMAFASVAILIGGAVVVTRHQADAPKTEVSTASPAASRGAEQEKSPGAPSPAPMEPASVPEPIAAKPAATPRAEATHGGARPKTEPKLDANVERPRDVRRAPPAAEPALADEGAPAPEAAPAQLATASKEDEKPASTTAQLVKQCEAAAANNDCAAVRLLAKKLAVQDPAAYRAKVRSNSSIARCLEVGVDAAAAPD